MEDVKALKARAKELRDQVSGYPIGKATADQLIKEIAHHEAAMKSLAQKMARAEKKKSAELPAKSSVKRAPAPKKAAAVKEAPVATKIPAAKKPEEEARVIAPSPMRRRILGMDNADLATHLYGSN
jgi:hypothetical protein